MLKTKLDMKDLQDSWQLIYERNALLSVESSLPVD